ncbi:MAG: DUF418 domain-containing protein [Spirosomataceae bacterium]
MTLTPTLPNERADVLDALRGFAVLGIFMSNSIAFSGISYLPFPVLEKFPTAQIDLPMMLLDLALVDGKFYTLFSLLFGIGFSIILVRNQQRGTNPLRIFYRRLGVLLCFGLAHLLLLWEGDILFLYALVGMLLPLFRNCSDKTLLRWAVALILAPIPIDVVRVLLHWSPGEVLFAIGQQLDKANGIPTDENLFPYYLSNASSGYAEILKWCQSGFFYRYQYILDSNRIFKVLGIFLVGYYVGRNQIFNQLEQYTPLLKKVQRWGFIIGIPANIAMAAFFIDEYHVPASWMGLTDTVTYALGVVPMSFAYAATLALLWHKKGHNSWLAKVIPVGRMALTNYLMQTILAISIFYGIGFGLGTHFGYSTVFLIVLTIYGFQVVFSTFWMRYFNFGPFEWLWRQLTYGKRLPIRK